MELHNWLLFASIALVATLTPGPAVLLASSHGLAYGWRRTTITIAGNVTGLLLMASISLAGLSAIILSSALIFTVVKLLGALYLLYLGVKLWRHGFSPITAAGQQPLARPRWHKQYLQGLLIAISNPKAIAFCTALFPQFIDHSSALPLQFAILILTFMSLSFICLSAYAWLAQQTRQRARQHLPQFIHKLFGAAFMASGVWLASASRSA